MKIGLEPSTQTVPESNTTNANFTRTNNTQSLAVANRDVIQTTGAGPESLESEDRDPNSDLNVIHFSARFFL